MDSGNLDLVLSPVEIIVDAAISRDCVANVEACFARRLPRFHDLPGLGKATGPVAVVGGGPSLRGQLATLRSFPGPIISCGTVHDYLVENRIPFKYHVDGEPDSDRVMRRWVKRFRAGVTYLIASQCPPSMFDSLWPYRVYVWHLAIGPNDDGPDFRGEPQIPGGHCNILRAWPIAAVMGYRDIHFFGFDCSFPEDCEDQHAYSYDWTREEPCGLTLNGRRFVTTPGFISQAETFSLMLARANGKFHVTVHGDSLAAAICGGCHASN